MLAWTNLVPSPFSQEISVSGGSGHPAQTLHLAPSNFHLFGHQKGHLAGMRFATDSDVRHAVISWLKTLSNSFFHTGIDALVSWWDKCLNISDDYVEKSFFMSDIIKSFT
jgi:hypothetical protein